MNGPETHPIYRFLKQQLPESEGGGGGTGEGKDLGWNFFKFIVNKMGQPVKVFNQVCLLSCYSILSNIVFVIVLLL